MRSLKAHPVGFAPAPSAIGPVHATDTTSRPNLVIDDDDALLINTADPRTYIVCTTAADIAAALTTNRDRSSADVLGETIASGASPLRGLRHDAQARRLPEGGLLHRDVRLCGPYTRESGYYRTRELAQAAFESGAYSR